MSGTRRGQRSLFGFGLVKKARCCRVPPPTSTLILHGCAFESMATAQKDKSPSFFSFLRTFWGGVGGWGGGLKELKTVRAKVTFAMAFSSAARVVAEVAGVHCPDCE